MSNEIKNLRNEKWVRVRFKLGTNKAHYEISNYGRAKSIDKKSKVERLLSGSMGKRGLKVINVRLKEQSHGHIFIHKFVGEKFVKKNSKKHTFLIHKDLDRGNNKWTNLKWVTEADWKKYVQSLPSVIAGKKKRSKNYKLTESKVKQIKRSLKAGRMTKRKIAEKFDITETQVRRIETGENWGRVTI